MIRICEPRSEEDFEKYYDLRWRILREPWDQSKGNERDDIDSIAIHRMVCTDDGTPIGVARLHFNSLQEAQIRYMAVDENYRGRGVGTMLLKELEQIAKRMGAKYVVLNARENAVDFYRKNGYRVIEKSYLLFGTIQHFKMKKFL